MIANFRPHRSESKWRAPAHFALAISVAIGVASCSGGGSPDRWVSLADGFVPATRISKGDSWRKPFIGGEALTLQPEQGGTGAWITTVLRAEDWEPAPFGISVWRARRPIWDVGLPAEEGRPPQELAGKTQRFDYVPFSKEILKQELEPGSFTGVIEFVYLKTEGERPEEARYSVYVERGRSVDGRWRIGIERFTCDGFPLWSGHSEEVVADVPRESALYFGSAGAATAEILGASAGNVIFRVLLDGEEILRHEQSVSDIVSADRHRIVLPPEARKSARFRFDVSGPAAICAVLDPRLGPAEYGGPETRASDPRAGDSRANVLLFLADTFRADNMKAYGERFDKSLTPHLDRFADEAVLFARAWAPASWTLPSQASMMSGLYPHQHGADRSKRQIAEEIETLAEAFARAGYRTGAITDSLLVSSRFGFDQGFQWFDESQRDLDQTLDEINVFFDADDGRPFFLFVQTYRTHSPYFASEQTREEYAQELDIQGDWLVLHQLLTQETIAWNPNQEIPDSLWKVVDRIERLYRGGVVDLDRGFGQLLSDLDRRDLAGNTYVVFTSDHGEAFGEHQKLFHGNGVWDANVRIPLVIRGPDLAPNRITSAATLVDLPRTLARMAKIPIAPRWGGRDLFDEDGDFPAFSFECLASGEDGLATLVDGPYKLLFQNTDEAINSGALYAAYDLSLDRDEERNFLLEDADWPAQLFKRHERELDSLRHAIFSAPRARLRPEDIAALAAVGYIDEE